jgi:hypothetical protein
LQIYVVDLCSPLCGVARAKAAQNGWSNVEVVEGDACTFQPEKKATVVTFSYSLSSKCAMPESPFLCSYWCSFFAFVKKWASITDFQSERLVSGLWGRILFFSWS